MKTMVRNLLHYAKRFRTSSKGSVATIFGVMMIPLMLSVGIVVDYSNYSRLQTRLQTAVDSGILAAAIAVRDSDLLDGNVAQKTENKVQIEAKLKSEFEKFFEANMGESDYLQFDDLKVEFDPVTGESSIQVAHTYKTIIFGVFADANVSLDSEAGVIVDVKQSGIAAASIFLVLDKSGSMAWKIPGDPMNTKKIDSLKAAVAAMHASFDELDPDKEKIRMGAASYNSWTDQIQNISWGSKKANDLVQGLTANGGTNSVPGVKEAYEQLKKNKEKKKHQEKNGEEPKKYIVFMTDGSNNSTGSDTSTKKYCDDAKNADMEIFSVAFVAPTRGQQLLQYCATSIEHFFDAQDSVELVKAFQSIGKNVTEKVAVTK